MQLLRTHKCNELRASDVGRRVVLSGWVQKKRDHGTMMFIDLRDHYGITQLLITNTSAAYAQLKNVKLEAVIRAEGTVVARTAGNQNATLATGEIELDVETTELLGDVEPLSDVEALPFPIATPADTPEDLRLRYRFLDLRREKMHRNIVLRSNVISSIRRRMIEAGFNEIQTPILTSSSPEGARDYLVPSRKHHGKFYALPQAPQQFKQLLMVAGFDRYFQIAPCFRDEDARADRSPGEFYQLDVELSFVTRDEIFASIEPVLYGVFKEFSDWEVTPPPFPRIPYAESMMKYGSDKPDLRNPLVIVDVTDAAKRVDFGPFANADVIRAIRLPNAATQSRKFFDTLTDAAKSAGAGGLAYVIAGETPRGPLAKFLKPENLAALMQLTSSTNDDAIAFIAGAANVAGIVRGRAGELLNLIEPNAYRFCWVVDYPFYELDDEGNVSFSHNPFSMPVGGLEALETKPPLEVIADQYDIVCNAIELSSGAVRNHRPDVMVKAFELAGYSKETVVDRFGAMLNAFRFGAPPHGGLAPGIDRIVMLLAGEVNIREVIAFPLNQQGLDLMMNAPNYVTEKQLRELSIRVVDE